MLCLYFFTAGWFLGIFSAFAWVPVASALLTRRESLLVDAGHARAFYLPKKEAVCLELPNGKWVGVWVRGLDPSAEEVEAFLAWLRASYGERMVEM